MTQPSDRITKPVEWIKTTYGDYQRTMEESLGGSLGVSDTAVDTAIYVVQVQGTVLFTTPSRVAFSVEGSLVHGGAVLQRRPCRR